MAELMIIRHAERNRVSNLHEALHVKITHKGRDDARALGKRMSKFFNGEGMEVMASQLDRCVETARSFASGYGKDAKYIGTEQTGNLSYLFPGMSAYMNHDICCESALADVYGEIVLSCPRMFEHDYAGTMRKWLSGEFNGILISPIEIYGDVQHIAKKSMGKRLVLFTSDIQISIMCALQGMEEFAERRPGYLHGMQTSNFWKGKWKMFRPDELEEMNQSGLPG